MKEYEVVWEKKFFRIVSAKNKKEAENIVGSLEAQKNFGDDIGNYWEDSFRVLCVVEGEREGGAFCQIEDYNW